MTCFFLRHFYRPSALSGGRLKSSQPSIKKLPTFFSRGGFPGRTILGVSKNRGVVAFPPKMDGENNGKPNPMNKWDDLGGVFPPLFFGLTPIYVSFINTGKDDLGGFPTPIFGLTPIYVSFINTGKDDLGGFPTPIFGLTPILFQGFFWFTLHADRSTVSAVAIAERRPGHLRILATTL